MSKKQPKPTISIIFQIRAQLLFMEIQRCLALRCVLKCSHRIVRIFLSERTPTIIRCGNIPCLLQTQRTTVPLHPCFDVY
jgi:hypothetical protein